MIFIVTAKVRIRKESSRFKKLNIVNMLSLYMSQKVDKRIPVSEDIWKKLGDLKGAGETYDELLEKIIRDHNRMELARKMKRVEERGKEELVPLDDL